MCTAVTILRQPAIDRCAVTYSRDGEGNPAFSTKFARERNRMQLTSDAGGRRAAGVLSAFLCLPGLAAVAANARAQEAAPPAEQTGEAFDVWEFRVLGNTTLPSLAIERAVYPHLGKGKRIADVELARQDLERSFRDAGYGT